MPTSSPLAPSVGFASLNGLRVVAGSVRIPGTGAWTADVMLDAAPPVALPTDALGAQLIVGDLALTGTILAGSSGSFAEAAWYRVVGGTGGWAAPLPARAYHNDAGVRLGDVLADAAAEAQEVLVLDDAVDATVLQGVDYARSAGAASRCLGELLALASPASSWWTDLDGLTHVGARTASSLPAGTAFDLLDYHPAQRVLELATDALAPFQPGVQIVDARLAAALVVREVEIVLGATLRLRCWVDEAEALTPIDNRLVRVLRALIREALPQLPYLALARYRVVQMTAGRADLQACDPKRGLPDLQLVRLAPGVIGMSQSPTPGSIVGVAFMDGDPSQPLVVSYPPSDDAGFISIEPMTLGGPTTPISLAGGTDAVALATPITAWAASVVSALAAATITVPPLVSAAALRVTAT